MSCRERDARARKAENEGYWAYKYGKTQEDCPYKRSDWGMGGAWDMGFNRARNEDKGKDD